MKVKVNVHVNAAAIYRILLKELQKDIKQQVKLAKRPAQLHQGYTYTQKLKFHDKEYHKVKSQYPNYTQTISYRLQPLDENYTCIIYQEKLHDVHFGIRLLSFLKGHLYRMKIVQYLHHLEDEAKKQNEIHRNRKGE